MKTFPSAAFVVPAVLFAGFPAKAASPDGRSVSSFNGDFRFALGSRQGGESPDFDDSGWDAVGLPHSFSIPYFRSPRFYEGEGWYRKHFSLGAVSDRRYRLDFEAAFRVCEVFVNGSPAGRHEGGYTGFSVDLTPYLKTGDNLVAIRVDNRWRADLPPRAGEHVFSGGVYRDVRLVETGPVSAPRNGLRVTTPEVSATAAKVNADLRLTNAGAADRTVVVRAELISPEGLVVTSGEARATLRAGATTPVAVPGLGVASPELWSPDRPRLYTVRVTVLEGSTVLDRVAVRTGLRWFRFDRDKGFFLNGDHLWLRGANRHQDQAGWGDAVANTAHYRDAKLLKDAGFNFVRGSHYPHDPAFLEACDELGLLVWSENTFWGIGGFGPDGTWSCSAYPPSSADQPGFEANDRRLLAEMIDDDFNHPSVIVWSMSNEPFFTEKSVMEKARRHIATLVEDTHRLDPSRPAGIGGAQRAGFDRFGDVIGYNGDGANFPKPDRPSLVAEYGSVVSNRPGKYDPCWGDTRGERPEWRSGNAIWCGFHHGSIAGDMGRMGIIDYFRLPLRQWYWYRNEYAGIAPPAWPSPGVPVALSLVADRSKISNDGTEDAHLVVTVLGADGRAVSDSPEVKLTIVSGPGEFPTGPSITFRNGSDIDIRDGAAAIAFRSWHGGETVIRAESPGLAPAEIRVTTRGEPSWMPGYAAVWRKPRRYSPVPVSDKTAGESRDNLAFTRPTRVSSQEAKNPAESANDGDVDSRWCADSGALPAFWQVDLENFYAVGDVMLALERPGDYRLRVESSEDAEAWRPLNAVPGPASGIERRYTAPGTPRARFVRVVFTGLPSGAWPSLREVKVSGKPAE